MAANPHPQVRAGWLDLVREEALDRDLPIIDAHHHLWDKPGDRYLAKDLIADSSGHNVVATIFAEGDTAVRPDGPEEMKPVGETEMALAEGLRAGCGVVAGIVARADPTIGAAIGAVLDAHAAAGGGRFRGIRFSTPWHADPSARGSSRLTPAGLLYDPNVRAGLAELERRGLIFDAWMYHTQLGDLADLAHAMPGLKIVLNHCGGPLGIGPYHGRRDEVFADWSHWIRRLSAFPNLAIKVGGLGMRLTGFGFDTRDRPPGSAELAQAWKPYVLTCIEAFGAGRSMFESNFPVDKGSCSYGVLWNAFKRLTRGASADERQSLFFGAANQSYSLDLEAPEPAGGVGT